MPLDPVRTATAELEHAYQRHRAMVRRALAQLGVEPAALDDATQDVFVVLVRRIADFDRSRSWTNWLWGIAKGVAAGHRRARARRRRLAGALPEPDTSPTPDEALARGRAAERLEAFLATLDADRCAVFVLAEIEGCTGPEIAARLGVNLNTAYARLRAARARFDEAVGRAPPRVTALLLPRLAIGHLAATLAIAPAVRRAPGDTDEPRAPAVAARQPADPRPRPSIARPPALDRASSPSTVEPEEVILVEEAPPARAVSHRPRPRRAEPPAQPVTEPVEAPLLERVLVSPALARPDVRPGPRVTVRRSFLDRLGRLEREL